MSDPAAYYALHAKCVCLREIMGLARRNDEPEFEPEVVEEFYAQVRSVGWVQQEGGAWSCGAACPGAFKIDPNQFAIRPGLKTKYAIKTINPDYYGTVEVENL